MNAHQIASAGDGLAYGLAGVLASARQDRLALQAEADAVQAQRNLGAVERALRVMAVLGRQVLAFRGEVTALESDNARLKRELAQMRSRALEAEGGLTRASKDGRLHAA